MIATATATGSQRPRPRGLFRFLAGMFSLGLGVGMLGACNAATPGKPEAAPANPPMTAPTSPPQGYRLADVVLRITRQAGHGIAPMQRITLTGQGPSSRQIGDKLQPFALPTSELLTMVNALYAVQFFALPSNYSQQHSVYVKPDGTVGLGQQRMMDTANTEVCFAVTGFEKCVKYHHLQVPTDLDAVVQRLLADAQRLAGG